MTGCVMNRIAILDDYQNVALRMADWSVLYPQCEVVTFNRHTADQSKLITSLADFDIVMVMRERTAFCREVFAALPKLKLLVTSGKANAAIDVVAARERGITVCGTESLSPPTAELTWGLILALLRDIPRQEASLRAGQWQSEIGIGLHGKTLGIVGLGRIGTQVALVGRAFGMQTIAWSPRLTPEAAEAKSCHYVRLPELMAEADVVSIHSRLDASSRGLIGAAELGAMKSTAFLVNTARAGLIDQSALLKALHDKSIAGFGADVFDVEPMTSGHPLLAAPRTVLTPHLGYVTEETYRIFFGQAVEDMQAFLRGAPIRVLER
jgi:phosphoglycerate dehydrogenase-like enzyme